jgi:hypothetical protein
MGLPIIESAMRLRSVVSVSALLAAFVVPADSLHAAPPTNRVVAATAAPGTFWINHEIIPGERLDEIADRYAVSIGSILRWNNLDPNRPQFWVGEQLRIQTQLPDRGRHKVSYVVRPSDTWDTIAYRFGVDRQRLEKAWNPHELTLQTGHSLSVWVENGMVEQEPTPGPLSATLPVPPGAQSIGRPEAGTLVNGVQIPVNPALYTVRNPDHSFGSTHAIDVLQRSIAIFRARTGFDREVTIWDMSLEHGGHYGPHRSHRSGRDVDIGLPLRAGFTLGTAKKGSVDWEATWHLIRAFIESGEVRYVFLSRQRQISLYKAALSCGATPEELEPIIQYPSTEKVGIVRHSPGHTGHIHVRFMCGLDEPGCIDG